MKSWRPWLVLACCITIAGCRTAPKKTELEPLPHAGRGGGLAGRDSSSTLSTATRDAEVSVTDITPDSQESKPSSETSDAATQQKKSEVSPEESSLNTDPVPPVHPQETNSRALQSEPEGAGLPTDFRPTNDPTLTPTLSLPEGRGGAKAIPSHPPVGGEVQDEGGEFRGRSTAHATIPIPLITTNAAPSATSVNTHLNVPDRSQASGTASPTALHPPTPSASSGNGKSPATTIPIWKDLVAADLKRDHLPPGLSLKVNSSGGKSTVASSDSQAPHLPGNSTGNDQANNVQPAGGLPLPAGATTTPNPPGQGPGTPIVIEPLFNDAAAAAQWREAELARQAAEEKALEENRNKLRNALYRFLSDGEHKDSADR